MRQQYLKGEEIFLSPTEEPDIEILWEIKNSGFARKYMSSSLPKTREDVSKEVKSMQENGSVFFSIVKDRFQEIIGYVCLEIVSNVIRAAEMHICISEVYSGRGYGKEVISLMTDYAFEELNIHSIRAMIRENNQRSVRCFQSQGYRLIGTLPEWSFYNGKYNDCHILDCIPRFRKEQVLIRKAKKEDF